MSDEDSREAVVANGSCASSEYRYHQALLPRVSDVSVSMERIRGWFCTAGCDEAGFSMVMYQVPELRRTSQSSK